ncbi:ABC transporter substrate-binding protein [Christensenellaceae bacterium OttesenSCG-928-K19]|nr:ABC transporter substrate-binding protein [Christensenellaceae bacterium OttesenSCG-928-K19]
MRSVKKLLSIAVLSIFVFLCSCSFATQTTETPETEAVPSATTQPAKIAGGDMFIAIPADVDSFDPLEADSEDLVNLLTLVYETPLKYETNGRIVNNLVERIEVNETKTQFTFVLRNDVYFSDGTKMTADDMVYSANKVRGLYGGTQPSSSNEMGDGEDGQTPEEDTADQGEEGGDVQAAETETNTGEANGNTGSRYRRYAGLVVDIEKINDQTVLLTMDEPGNAALHFMTFPVMNAALDAQELPVGTGPYMVEGYSDSGEITLVVNDRWWQKAPYIEKIVAKPAEGINQKLEFVQSSMIDLVTTDVLYASKYSQPQVTQVIDYMTNYYDCLIPNQISAKMKDVKVRQAISYAIDRREILSTVLLNHGVPTNLPIAPDNYAYESKYKISDYDRQLAKDLLEEAGYRSDPDGDGAVLQLEMIVLSDRNQPYKKEAAKTIKKQLEDVGIVLTIFELDSEEYMILLEGGNFDLAYCSYYLDVVPDFEYLFGENGEGNYGHVSNDEINKAVKEYKLAVTEEEVLSAYSDLQRVLTERVPQIGLYFRMNSIICDAGIQGIAEPRQNSIYSHISEWSISYVADAFNSENAAAQPEQQPETE